MTTSAWTTDALVMKYDEVRSHTERLTAPLSAEDQTVQSMADVSPTKWHCQQHHPQPTTHRDATDTGQQLSALAGTRPWPDRGD